MTSYSASAQNMPAVTPRTATSDATAKADPAPADPPPPPLAPAQMYARFLCPGCGRVRRFESRRAMSGAVQPLGCQCGRVLGVVTVDAEGMTLLRLAAV